MAGNPFRRKPPTQPQSILTNFRHDHSPDKHLDDPGTHPHPERAALSGPLDSLRAAESERRPSVVKQVRIVTPPPLSPDPLTPTTPDNAIQKVADEAHAGSPPPSPTLVPNMQGELFQRNLVEDIASQGAEVMENTRRNSASDSVMPALPSTKASPANPFAKTLATMQPSAEHQFEERFPAIPGADDSAEDGRRPPAKPSMDVDSFKDMLMAGIPKTQNAAPPRTGAAQPSFSGVDAGGESSTDVSSTSKPSTIDSSIEPGMDSPRSYDDYETDSDDPSRQTASTAPKKKPPPPAHRHGKLVVARAPETVSFADFDPFPQQSPSGSGTVARSDSSSRATEYSKPVPPPPPALSQGRGQASADATTAGGSMARQAPAPPIARRASGIRTSGEHGGPSNARPMSPSTNSGANKGAKVPPPPPSRRGGTARASQASDNASIMSDASSVVDLGQGHGRSVAVPPPPPRRRRGSSKSSLEAEGPGVRAAVGQNMALETVSRAAAIDGGSESAAGRDLLAEMSALQAEIDALRRSGSE